MMLWLILAAHSKNSRTMLESLSEVLLSWSQWYIVEVMHYTLACMVMLEDFPEGIG